MLAAPILLVGVDGSPESFRALDTAARMASATGAVLRIVHVERVPPAVHTAPIEAAAAAVVANELAADQAHIECELTLAGGETPWHFEQRDGSPARELLRAADEVGATAIVVGHRAQRRPTLLRVRSTTVEVLLREARLPVLVVPSPGREGR